MNAKMYITPHAAQRFTERFGVKVSEHSIVSFNDLVKMADGKDELGVPHIFLKLKNVDAVLVATLNTHPKTRKQAPVVCKSVLTAEMVKAYINKGYYKEAA